MDWIRKFINWIRGKEHQPHTGYALWTADKTAIPIFEFVPTQELQSTFSNEASFNVINHLELILQQRGLMADCLTIEVKSKNQVLTVLWLRYSTTEFNNKGSAQCFDAKGMCGYLQDNKEK
jgi:hypothetical protein